MAEGMARELAQTRIGVTALCPGGVQTHLFESERNRPAELPQAGTIGAESQRRVAALTASDRTDRAAPDDIAAFVLEAIRNRQLYLFPMQPHFKDAVRERLRLIEAALNASPTTGT
jgi:NAD(P)-dependent dehydrogenase (short-subunit alcohol dehydrogenase family)